MDPKGMKPPMPEGMGVPPMMQQMMQKMMAGMQEFNPMAMCQAMMTSVAKSAELAAYATPEARGLFEEWARSVEEEVLALLKKRGRVDLPELAHELKISTESALYFLGKLVREGKATISGIQATEVGGGS
ncbi:MAG: hypothetical protein HYT85_10420 [candidate division NC10 bacterium]|nr:hypothetical protein [candidate division NC10 bacterium]MBI3086891.1 hypothetical protein [candidate division NC10 bacterium]MBI3122040.1 hypothetical protein [candidate division NC10 bacterium]